MSTNENDRALLTLLNWSGFPFQLRIETEVSQTDAHPPWGVIRELPWHHPTTQENGYIDLVASNGRMRAVIECKRAETSRWLFLVPRTNQRETKRARCLSVMRTHLSGSPVFVWGDLWIDPSSHEAPFCIASWKDGKDGMLLERIGEKLLLAVEAVALKELAFDGELKFFLPIVVTAAQLWVARFNSEATKIESGELADAEFSEVPVIRFRKGMAHGLPPPLKPVYSGQMIKDLTTYSADYERTIFVVNSSHVSLFFSQLEINEPPSGRWPHVVAQEGPMSM